MEGKRIKLRFNTKEELVDLGKETLLGKLLPIIEGLDEKYVLRTSGREFYDLLGFKTSEALKESLNYKPVDSFSFYLETFASNIIKALQNQDSFISRCFYNPYDSSPHREMEIQFNLSVWNTQGKDSVFYQLELCIMSFSSDGCGSGRSIRFDLIDFPKLNRLKDEISGMNIPESVKRLYLERFEVVYDTDIDISLANEWISKEIIRDTDYYIEDYQEDFNRFETLKEQGFQERLLSFYQENEFTKPIFDAISVDYVNSKASSYDVWVNKVKCKEGEYFLNENKVEVKFLGVPIKTISKTARTVYEIA